MQFKYKVKKFSITFVLLSLAIAIPSFSCRQPAPERRVWTKVKTFAGINKEFGEPFGAAFKNGELFVSDGENGRIWRVAANGAMQILTDKLDTPSQIVFDKNGDLIVADSGTQTIKKIKSNGEIETIAGVENTRGFQDGAANSALFNSPIGVAVSGDVIYVADTYNDKIRAIENGQVSTLAGGSQGFADGAKSAAKFDTPCGLAIWTDGSILVADSQNRRVRVVEPNGNVSTLSGDGKANLLDGQLANAEFVQPAAVAVASSGAIFVADGNAIRAIGARSFPFVETISNDVRGYADGDLRHAQFNRPSGLAFDADGDLFVADSENQTVRVFTGAEKGAEISAEQRKNLRFTPEEFRNAAAPRWTYNPPETRRDIAGTLGEIRGEISDNPDKNAWFHNGLDIAGSLGETARFVRGGKVLKPTAAENFGGLRELLRLSTVGYIHVRLGRDANQNSFGDERFEFSRGADGKLNGVRVPRGAKFAAGEVVGTLNPFNHVHLIAGRTGAEMNALDAFIFPNISDKTTPTIEKVSLFDENWNTLSETQNSAKRITLNSKTRIVVRAYDQMDGNDARRRLGIYKLGYQILRADKSPVSDQTWTIIFDRMPDERAVKFVYAHGSQSGYTPETVFNYIASNRVEADDFREDFFDAGKLENGAYILRVFAADFFGNTASKDISFEVNKTLMAN